MKAVLSIANVAAWSGKTTVAVNLAAEFAERGLRTLLVDADPQARATTFFMKEDEVVGTLSDVLLPKTRRVPERPTAIWDVFSPTSLPHLGVVAGGIGLAVFEGLESSRATDLSARLEPISDFHDIVILDTPSSLSLLTRACLCAATHVLVPVSPSGQGEEGLRLIYEYLASRPCSDTPPDVSVVCNQFDCQARTSGLLAERLRAGWGGKVLDTIIHRDVQVEAGTERRQTTRAHSPLSATATLYARLADEVLARLSLAPVGQTTAAENW